MGHKQRFQRRRLGRFRKEQRFQHRRLGQRHIQRFQRRRMGQRHNPNRIHEPSEQRTCP